jgi:hypothetical protein
MSEHKRYTNARELRGVLRYEYRTRHLWNTKRAAIRAAWWWLIRRYPSEICLCGRPVGQWIGDTYWHADNALWNGVMGWPGWEQELGEYAYLGVPGTRCPRCFTERARKKGVHVHWEPHLEPNIELAPEPWDGVR